MKRLLVCLLVLVVCFGFVSATGNSETVSTKVDVEEGPKVVNGFSVGSKVKIADESYNEKSMEELYQEALEENKKLVIYSITAKVSKIVEQFNNEYPGLDVEGIYVNNADLKTKISTEADAGHVNADVVIASDATGQIYYEFYDKGYLEAYYPANVTKFLSEEDLKFGMPLYAVCDLWYYNCKDFPTCPINNIWDLIETDSNGESKFAFYTQDLTKGDALGIFAQFTADSDNLASAYELKYGSSLEYTYNEDAAILGLPENNAGYEYIYRLAQLSKLNIVDKPDDRVLAIHNSTGGTPSVGFATGAKRAKDIDNGWGTLAWVKQAAPSACYIRPTYIYLTGGTDNPAASRLFAYYALGGDDPTNSNGLAQVLAYGSWSQRSDFVDKKNDVALSDINYASYNLERVYENYLDMCDAWMYWFDKFKK